MLQKVSTKPDQAHRPVLAGNAEGLELDHIAVLVAEEPEEAGDVLGQSFIRRAVQAHTEVTRSGRRVGRTGGVMVGARGVHVQAKPGHLRVGDTRSARWLNAAVHTLTHPSAKLSRPEAAEADDAGEPTVVEPAAAPLVPAGQAAESLFAALAAEADEETAGA